MNVLSWDGCCFVRLNGYLQEALRMVYEWWLSLKPDIINAFIRFWMIRRVKITKEYTPCIVARRRSVVRSNHSGLYCGCAKLLLRVVALKINLSLHS